MGLVRLLLAISVVLFHAGSSFNIANSTVAVLSFFIISGFYMAMILDKKYTGPKATFLFWSNRFLRIFPLYWVTLVILLLFVLAKLFLHIGTEDNAIIHYLTYSSPNSPSFFTNLINLIFRNITLIFNIDYFRVDNSQPGYLLISQAWTLQVELLFYLLAPFLMKLSKKLFLVLSLTYSVIYFGLLIPRHLIPPTLAFIFLNYLIFFLLGMFSYRFLFGLFSSKKIKPIYLKIIFLSFVSYLVLYNLILKISVPLMNMESLPYYLALVLALPATFVQTRLNTMDNFIGKLSYPVYIMHLFVVKLLSNLGLDSASLLRSLLVLFITLYISYLSLRFIDRPIDQFRQERIAKR